MNHQAKKGGLKSHGKMLKSGKLRFGSGEMGFFLLLGLMTVEFSSTESKTLLRKRSILAHETGRKYRVAAKGLSHETELGVDWAV